MTDRQFKAIALLAFRAAESPSYEDFIRKVHRWFSRSFSVPLPEAEGMADEYLLRHYFEDIYCTMADSTTDEAHKEWTDTRGRLLKAFDPPKAPTEADMDDDEYWEKALADEFERDNPDAMKPQGSPEGDPRPYSGIVKSQTVYEPDLRAVPQNLKVDKDGWTHQEVVQPTPNLEHKDVSVQADDDIPDDT